jgi:hypothetical protein
MTAGLATCLPWRVFAQSLQPVQDGIFSLFIQPLQRLPLYPVVCLEAAEAAVKGEFVLHITTG